MERENESYSNSETHTLSYEGQNLSLDESLRIYKPICLDKQRKKSPVDPWQ